MTLKVYADRISNPTRAVLIFCKVNRIDFEEVEVDLLERQQNSPEYEEINPMKKVPAIVDGKFKLFESHAILIYLASVFPGIPDHWYPSDVFKRAKINALLHWDTPNLYHSAVKLFFHSRIYPGIGLPFSRRAAADAEVVLSASLAKLESFLLEGNGPFLLGSLQPSIADLSLACDVMQLEAVDMKIRHRILSPFKRVLQWVDDTKSATRPHFDEVTAALYEVEERLQKRRLAKGNGDINSSDKGSHRSKM